MSIETAAICAADRIERRGVPRRTTPPHGKRLPLADPRVDDARIAAGLLGDAGFDAFTGSDILVDGDVTAAY